MSGSRHEWVLYVRSDIERKIRDVLNVDNVQYYVHVDSGYNRREVVDVPFQRAHLTAVQRATNRSTSSVRVTLEWLYKEVKLYWSTVNFKRKRVALLGLHASKENSKLPLSEYSILVVQLPSAIVVQCTLVQFLR